MTSVQAIATKKHAPLIAARDKFDIKALREDLECSVRPDFPEQQRIMRELLFQQMPIGRLNRKAKENRELIAHAYIESHRILNSQAELLNKFFEALADSQIEIRGSHGAPQLRTVVAKTRDAILGRISYRLLPSPSILSAETAALEAPELLMRLRADIERRASFLAAHFFETLGAAAKKQIVGHIRWTGRDTCQYVYFTAPIICEGTVTRSTADARNVKHVDTTKYQHRFGIHGHDLMSAAISYRMPPAIFVPARVDRLVRAIPPIIRPLLAVVDGLLIAERIVEWDAFESTIIEERVIPQAQFDPAIVLGPYVLAGWSDRDLGVTTMSDSALQWAAKSWMKLTR